MKRNRLSQKDIDAALEKLRQKYDNFIITYMQSPIHKSSFEERYSEALATRMDLQEFIQGEIVFIERLIKIEDEKKELEQVENEKKWRGEKDAEIKGYADRVIEDLERRIESYPVIKIHQHAPNELGKLFGTMSEIEKRFWPNIQDYLLIAYPGERNGAIAELDHKIWELTAITSSNVPKVLERYIIMLGSTENQPELYPEMQNAIKSCAFWLHDVVDSIKVASKITVPNEDVEEAVIYIQNVLEDFRLRDIKQKGRKDTLWSK